MAQLLGRLKGAELLERGAAPVNGERGGMGVPHNGPSTAPSHALRMTRLIPLIVLLGGLVLFFAFGLEHQVTLAALKQHRDELQRLVADNPAMAATSFACFYALAIACSLPIGTILTLSAGFLFGTLEGGALVVVSATVGATAIFFAAKTALASFFEARLGTRLRQMEEGFRRNAFNYLLVLRLIPLFPFFLVNLAAGLLGVRLSTYVAATLLGIIPGTFVYAGLGNGLGKIFDTGQSPDLHIIFRPEIAAPLIGLAALAILPVVWRAIARRRKA